MKKKIPARIYYKVGVGFLFSLIIIWYFAFRFIFPTLRQYFSAEICGYTTFVLSFTICLTLIKLSIEKELENDEEEFSLVARNPDIEIPKAKITTKSLFFDFCIGIIFCFIVSLPVTVIGLIKIISNDETVVQTLIAFTDDFWAFYLFCFLISLFAVIFVFHSLKRWHWTKHQF